MVQRQELKPSIKIKTMTFQEEEKLRREAEEYNCAQMYLNDLEVPTEKEDKPLSLVGRIKALQKMVHDDAYSVPQ